MEAGDRIDQALAENERARKLLARIKSVQIRNAEHRDFFKATSLSWFKSHRPPLIDLYGQVVTPVDVAYQSVLNATERASAKSTYSSGLNKAKKSLIELREQVLLAVPLQHRNDAVPNFGVLVGAQEMQEILSRRWRECANCIEANAPLAATVMMGGLLEALLVSRANILKDKSVLFRCKSTPIDSKVGKPFPLQHWKLSSYIDVGHELGWISRSAKDVAEVLRDYRNYVHPEKERSHGIVLSLDDARLLWDVTKSLSRELLSMKASA